jgi:hypothetical protein
MALFYMQRKKSEFFDIVVDLLHDTFITKKLFVEETAKLIGVLDGQKQSILMSSVDCCT